MKNKPKKPLMSLIPVFVKVPGGKKFHVFIFESKKNAKGFAHEALLGCCTVTFHKPPNNQIDWSR